MVSCKPLVEETVEPVVEVVNFHGSIGNNYYNIVQNTHHIQSNCNCYNVKHLEQCKLYSRNENAKFCENHQQFHKE